MELIKAWKEIVEIAKDKKVSDDEVPRLIEAIFTIISVIAGYLIPLLAPAAGEGVGKVRDLLGEASKRVQAE